MYLSGRFYDQNSRLVTVMISTTGDGGSIEIGSDASGVYFADDPVEITSEVNDTFDHLLRHSATIRLLTRSFLPGLFCTDCRNAVVNIYRQGTCIFAGFIEPQTYSQPYNDVLDELELNCIDALSALQFAKYQNVGTAGADYTVIKSSAGQRTFGAIIKDMIDAITVNIDVTYTNSAQILYDCSRAKDNTTASRYQIFNQISISELLFLGDDEDDVWQQDKVLEEILKYLNLHIVQQGFKFYIFAWETVKGTERITWNDFTTGVATETTERKTVTIELSNVADTDTQISIGEVFNQIAVSCDVKEIENVIESPLNEDYLKSPYTWYQKYMTEYFCWGEGRSAYDAFYAITHGRQTDYDAAVIVDWYLQVMQSKLWKFPDPNGGDLIENYCKDGTYQQRLPNSFAYKIAAAIFSLGKVETKANRSDNSPTSSVSMSNHLIVSINGNENDSASGCYPNETAIKAAIPVAIYKGNTSGGVYSPADESTTNYIVISGKVVLNPIMAMTDTYKRLHDRQSWGDDYWHHTVPSRNNEDGRYYTQQLWQAYTPSSTPTWANGTDHGLVPFTNEGPQLYEYNYSAVGDGTDKISKVSVLACMLIIGDKCVVETGTQGQTSDFRWKPYKTREQCASDDEYYQQCFYIGFDPKIGDKIIGTEYDMQNNVNYTIGIDAKGIAIPIRQSDNVSGTVQFMVLGPVNALWDDITRRHPTFFRSTKWTTNSVPLLAHVSNIQVKDFEIKVYSDNGLTNNTGDSDLVYMSDTGEAHTNRKDDIEFKINSALTTDECRQLGVTNTVKMSTPMAGTGALLSIYDYIRKVQEKPERLYVDSYYDEYHLPRVSMTQKLADTAADVGIFLHYYHPAIDKEFFAVGISRNLAGAYAELNLKEVGEDWGLVDVKIIGKSKAIEIGDGAYKALIEKFNKELEKLKGNLQYVEYAEWSANVMYYCEAYNSATGVFETSYVWSRGKKWMCLKTLTTQEPKFGCTDWQVVEGDTKFYLDFTEDYQLYDPDNFNGTLTIEAKWGTEDVTDIIEQGDIVWERETKDKDGIVRELSDEAWNIRHDTDNWPTERKQLVLVHSDLDAGSMGFPSSVKFRATATLRDGVDEMTESVEIEY